MKKIYAYAIAAAALWSAAPQTNAAVITDLPAGAQSQEYTMKLWLFTTFQGTVFPIDENMLPTTLAFDGSDVYWADPLTTNFPNATSYLKGTLQGDKITFTLPQQISQSLWVYRMKRTTSNPPWEYAVDTESTAITMNIDPDGIIYMTESDSVGSVIFGYGSSTGTWRSEGVYGTEFRPFTDKLVETPADLTPAGWTIRYDGNSREVTGGWSGNDFYVKGLCEGCPEGWLRGTLADGKVTFANEQYVGVHSSLGYRMWMRGAHIEDIINPSLGYPSPEYVFDDAYVMEWDAEAERLTGVNSITFNPGEYYKDWPALRGLHNLTMVPTREITDFTPATPRIETVSFYPNYDPADGWDCIDIDLSLLNVDGQQLDPAGIYYRILFDGVPYVLSPDSFEGVDVPMEWIPFSFTSYDLESIGGSRRSVSLYYDGGVTQFGVEEKYVAADGTEYISERALWPEMGITDMVASGAASVVYTDLCGRRIDNPTNGVYIMTAVYPNGLVKTRKVMIK